MSPTDNRIAFSHFGKAAPQSAAAPSAPAEAAASLDADRARPGPASRRATMRTHPGLARTARLLDRTLDRQVSRHPMVAVVAIMVLVLGLQLTRLG